MKPRLSWQEYWALMAEFTANRSTCVRRQVGAVIVTPDQRLVSSGYNGAPSGVKHCLDTGCIREKFPAGEALHLCIGGHAEANAISNAARQGVSVRGCTVYCTLKPCQECLKSLVNAGIKEVRYLGDYPITTPKVYDLIIEQSGIVLTPLKL